MILTRNLISLIFTISLLNVVLVRTKDATDVLNDSYSLLDQVNEHVGGKLLVLSEESVRLDTGVLRNVLSNLAGDVIRKEFHGNFLTQLPLISAANLEIKKGCDWLDKAIDGRGVPLHRTKRSLGSLVQDVLGSVLKAVLSSVQTTLDSVLGNIYDTLQYFYVKNPPEQPLLQLVANLNNSILEKLSDIIIHIRDALRGILHNTASDRVKRSLLDDLWQVDFAESLALEEKLDMYHARGKRSIGDVAGSVIEILKKLLRSVTSIINRILKELIIKKVDSVGYDNIGKAVTFPLRKILNSVLDTVLPCNKCISLA